MRSSLNRGGRLHLLTVAIVTCLFTLGTVTTAIAHTRFWWTRSTVREAAGAPGTMDLFGQISSPNDPCVRRRLVTIRHDGAVWGADVSDGEGRWFVNGVDDLGEYVIRVSQRGLRTAGAHNHICKPFQTRLNIG